ncbi:MAG TPA: trehalose-phosphatase [Acidobacteriaceae bacterium]
MTPESDRPNLRGLPREWARSSEAEDFWKRVRCAPRSILLLDYDGTLAPFKKERLEAFPYAGVEDRLVMLEQLPNVRFVLVSGRSARELEKLLDELLRDLPGKAPRFEIWGSHGQERLRPDGSYDLSPLPAAGLATLNQIRQEITRLGFSDAVEVKPTSVAIHWRGVEPEMREKLRSAVESLLDFPGPTHPEDGRLELLAFDGGLEVRSHGRTKGTAIEQILAEEERGLPVAYLGDDMTDEDAFTALGDRGISILVRAEPRESRAEFWMKPPADLLDFLDEWVASSTAAYTSGSASGNANENGR